MFTTPISSPAPSPFTAPFSIGAGGANSTGASGNAGADTTFGSPAILTCTGGEASGSVPGPNKNPVEQAARPLGGNPGDASGPGLLINLSSSNKAGFNPQPTAPSRVPSRDATLLVSYQAMFPVDPNHPGNPQTSKLYGVGGVPSNPSPNPQQNKGSPGALLIFENKLS